MTQAHPTPHDAARAIAARLRDAGHLAYFAGGCVRDRLLGLEPADVDIATSARPDEIASIFKGAKGVGESFGVMLVRSGGVVVEVATFRADGPYSDARRPDSVRFASPEEDALRRDFTVNGLFMDPSSGEVIDFVGGRPTSRPACCGPSVRRTSASVRTGSACCGPRASPHASNSRSSR